ARLSVCALISAPLGTVVLPTPAKKKSALPVTRSRPLRVSVISDVPPGCANGPPPDGGLPSLARSDRRPSSPSPIAAFQVGLTSQVSLLAAIPLSMTTYEPGAPPKEPSLSWIVAPV